MNSIRIENLRCFEDTGKIELLPLNVAVGKNSCGKSTILRTFPLFKQTLEAKVSEPILWYGRYIDFGDFNQSMNNLSDKDEMTFSFNFDTNFNDKENVNISLTIKIERNYVSYAKITILDNNIKINYSSNGKIAKLTINDEDFEVKNDIYRQGDRGLIPKIHNIEERNKYSERNMFLFGDKADILTNDRIRMKLNEIVDINLENKFIFIEYIYKYFIEKLPEINEFDEDIINIIKKADKRRLNTIERLFDDDIEVLNINEKRISKDNIDKIAYDIRGIYKLIYNHALSKNLNEIIETCNFYLFCYFTNISYVAPLRATAERYYRIQGLAIDDIDSRGENVPMILKNMNEKERNDFENWMLNKFGISITTNSTEGHISLFIKKNNNKINIADTGFGYSQILPIILLLWKSKNKKNNSRSIYPLSKRSLKKLIVIEQPELHLHPKMQTQIIDVILEIIDETDRINFLIETHSQTIIDHIGSRIEDMKINRDKVNILLVEQMDNDSSSVRSVTYSEEGYLEEWPMDFFMGDEW